jgi:hypothetical protein
MGDDCDPSHREDGGSERQEGAGEGVEEVSHTLVLGQSGKNVRP